MRRDPSYDNWYRVEVSDYDGQIVAIEPEMLVGRDIGDDERAKVMRAVETLAGFIGATVTVTGTTNE